MERERGEVINIFRKIYGPSNYLREDFKERYFKTNRMYKPGKIKTRLIEENLS